MIRGVVVDIGPGIQLVRQKVGGSGSSGGHVGGVCLVVVAVVDVLFRRVPSILISVLWLVFGFSLFFFLVFYNFV